VSMSYLLRCTVHVGGPIGSRDSLPSLTTRTSPYLLRHWGLRGVNDCDFVGGVRRGVCSTNCHHRFHSKALKVPIKMGLGLRIRVTDNYCSRCLNSITSMALTRIVCRPDADFWEDLKANPENEATFSRAMACMESLSTSRFAKS
jgi:hypothetical protein